MPLFVPACAYERNPATLEEKRVLCDAALASVLDLLVREQPRPVDPLAWVAERLKEWEIQRLGARTATREAIETPVWYVNMAPLLMPEWYSRVVSTQNADST